VTPEQSRRAYRRQALVHALGGVVGHDNVSTDPAVLQEQAADWSWTARSLLHHGLPVPAADVLAAPADATQVGRVLQVAYDHGAPVVPRGGGSGTQGGTFAPYGGIALDLRRLDTLVSIDTESLTATAGAGIDGAVLEQMVNEKGLTLAHYPGSTHRGATLGGYLAARGSGVVSTKYGKAEDMVLSVEAALPPGRLVRTRPRPATRRAPACSRSSWARKEPSA
jgi:alkyldihydroxyacetonephosphate synthase